MIKIKSTKPNPPLGKYPQLALWGQVGSAPTSSRTNMMIRMVLISFLLIRVEASRRAV